MVDAPETIGLVSSPFGFRLWNREEDDSEATAIRYLRADIAERQIAEAQARHSGELQRANSLYEQAVATEAESDRLAAEVTRLREALERVLNAAGCGVDLYNDEPGREAIRNARAALASVKE